MFQCEKTLKDEIVECLDEGITDDNLHRYGKRLAFIVFVTFLLMSVPINPYIEQNQNGISIIPEAFANNHLPIKVKQDRNSEIWQMPTPLEFVFKTGGEAPTQTWDSSREGWYSYVLNPLGGNDFEVQSGLIGTTFTGTTITHFDSNMTDNKGTETPRLFRLVSGSPVEVPLTFQSRTDSVSSEVITETVGGITVNEGIDIVRITEDYTASFSDFEIRYDFKEGQPLKHTFINNQTSSTQTYQFYHEFNLVEDEVEFEIQNATHSIKLKIKSEEIEYEINGVPQTNELTLTLDKKCIRRITGKF